MKSRFLAYALTALFGMATLTSCGDDDGLSAEQQAYITENKAYIWEKKAEKDENGNPVYTEIVALGDTALYRVIKKEGDWNSVPVAESTVHLLDLEGHLIDGTVFQQKTDSCQFGMTTLIPGFTAILPGPSGRDDRGHHSRLIGLWRERLHGYPRRIDPHFHLHARQDPLKGEK